jgi:tRNA pseudouridine32 synthase/23S rRNA pseudouridine746 synthase
MKPDPKGLRSVTTWKVLGRGPHDPSGPALRLALTAQQHSGNKGVDGRDKPDQDDAEQSNRLPTGVAWLALEPLTGRTHQLRVHCAAMGWPILGDNIYGTAPRFGGPGLHLHAREIVVPLSKNREPVRITAPVPAHMRDLLRACGFSSE